MIQFNSINRIISSVSTCVAISDFEAIFLLFLFEAIERISRLQNSTKSTPNWPCIFACRSVLKNFQELSRKIKILSFFLFENCFRAPGTDILSFLNNRVQSASSLCWKQKKIECKSPHILLTSKIVKCRRGWELKT